LPEETNTTEQHSVVTEWTAGKPRDNTFHGTSREVLRIAFSAHKHAIQQIGFNPYAKPGNDYGKLYLALGDGENDDYLNPEWTDVAQDLGKPQGKILRIDPRPDGTKPYTVPSDNPFVGRQGALGEIYAYGMRDPHRFSWDVDNRMILGHFGERKVESVYDVRPGDNFGWNKREGGYSFKGLKLDQNNVYKLPAGGEPGCDYTYPVASYGRDVNKGLTIGDVVGISGGFVYRGKMMPALQGMYVFGDVVSGKVFYAKASDMKRGAKGVVPPQAPLHQLKLFNASREQVTMSRLATGADNQRVDFRIGIGPDNELYFLTKADGRIWRVGAPPA
jgi:glucose/arabinose dehydrogenase